MDKKVTSKSILKIIKKRIRLRTVLLLAITLSFNSFAWFIYSTKVDVGVSAHVKSWNVRFQSGIDEIESYVNFDVNNIYPGMTTYNDSIVAHNDGESIATLSYEIVSATILGTTYTVNGTTLTSAQLLNDLENNYPFHINLSVSSSTINPTNGTSTFYLSVVWPYEGGNDELDTYWGEQSYDYHSTHPTTPSISLTIKVNAVQS